MSDFGAILIRRLEKAADRNQTVLDDNQAALDNNQAATHKLDVVIPVLEKDEKGNQIALAAMREVYGLIEADMEGRQNTIEELKKTKALLEKSAALLKSAAALLKSADFDFDNIQTIANPEIWLGDHLPTIKRALNIFNTTPAAEGEISLFDQALDSLENERFEDIAHAVKRSGEKRQRAAEEGAGVKDPEAEAAAAAAALDAIDAIKVATELRDALEGGQEQAQG